MNMYNFLFFILYIATLSPIYVYAQKESHIWHMGDGFVVDFNSGLPIVNDQTQINTLDKRSSFTMSDESGKLLFYTDGISIWDNAHKTIESNLFGDTYVTVLPYPNKPNLYYIIYIGWLETPESYPKDLAKNDEIEKKIIKSEIQKAKKNPPSKLYYTLLDIENKKCIEKNVFLSENILFTACIARHSNNTDYWLISHKENTQIFETYLINEKGFHKKSVQSKIGAETPYERYGLASKPYFIKSNIQGNHIVLNQVNKSNLNFELFTFDNSKGEIKGVKNISLKTKIDSVSIIGQEFSPNGKYLFTVFANRDSRTLTTTAHIKQFDIDIHQEIKEVGFITKLYWRMPQRMQLAPDGNIYIKTTISNEYFEQNHKNHSREPIICLKGVNKILNHKESLKIIAPKILYWNGRMPDVNHLLPLSLTDDDETLKVGKVFKRSILFETNQAILKPEYETELQDIVDFLKQNPTSTIEISGHTDNEGEETKNKTLSENRAKSLANFLIKNKIEPTRIKAIGYGSAKPIVENTTPKGKAKNRRIEFLITDKK